MSTATVKRVVKYEERYFKLVEGTTATPSLCDECVFQDSLSPTLTKGCEGLGGRCGHGIFRLATEEEYFLAKLQGVGS